MKGKFVCCIQGMHVMTQITSVTGVLYIRTFEVSPLPTWPPRRLYMNDN